MKSGIMQGRLSPRSPVRLQTFPWSTWREEFEHAALIGLDTIEWLFEVERFEENPIWLPAGVDEILDLVRITGVNVETLCFDYFMPRPFFRTTSEAQRETEVVLCRVIRHCGQIGIRTLLLPVLEESAVAGEEDFERLAGSLGRCLPVARDHGVRIGMESELPAKEYRAMIERIDDPAFGAYYDTGNAAALGYDGGDDVRALAGRLVGVHLKDRKLGGATQLLGEGDTRFTEIFSALKQAGFEGPLILQTAFGDDPVVTARRHREFVLSLWAAV